MGMSSASPKTFQPATPFGQSPASPIATQTQPLALNSGTSTPAMSGYSMTPMTPASDASQPGLDGGGSPQDLLAQFKANRATSGGMRMPFLG